MKKLLFTVTFIISLIAFSPVESIAKPPYCQAALGSCYGSCSEAIGFSLGRASCYGGCYIGYAFCG